MSICSKMEEGSVLPYGQLVLCQDMLLRKLKGSKYKEDSILIRTVF
jgi:hypothetical protein